uniref:Uncharacterized protein n=1 Tax=Tanacetum cinerariifolium TaxID=118510 RepID=A0A699V4K7_TANCI|nr:hypothetical protein [Tanacetum cinerariifolium]
MHQASGLARPRLGRAAREPRPGRYCAPSANYRNYWRTQHLLKLCPGPCPMELTIRIKPPCISAYESWLREAKPDPRAGHSVIKAGSICEAFSGRTVALVDKACVDKNDNNL